MSADPLDAALAARASEASSTDPLDAALAARAQGQDVAPAPSAPPSALREWSMAPVGAAEEFGKFATGAVAAIPAGVAYGGAAIGKAFGADVNPADVQRRVQNYFTYQPQTDSAKAAERDLATTYAPVMGAVTGAADRAAKKVGEVSPTAEAYLREAPAAAQAATGVLPLVSAVAGMRGLPREAPAEPDEELLKRSQELGYVVPPSTSNPTVLNRMAEGFAGKLTTAQAASARNMEVTNNLVRQELNLPEGTPLTQETLESVRQAQSPVYEKLKAIPDIQFGPEYEAELDKLATTAQKITATLPKYRATGSEQVQQLLDSLKPEGGTMDGETTVELSKSLRAEAASQELVASRTGDPTARTLARAYRGAGEAVENALERHLGNIGQPELATQFDNARRTIAKTYSVQNALDGAGNVDATKLGKQLLKGKPLSGNLEAAANFANTYPKAARVMKESLPGMSPLDVYGGAAIEAATGHPSALLIGPGRMAARAALLSPLGQKMAVPTGNALGRIPTMPTNMIGPMATAGLPAFASEPRKLE